MRIVYEIHSFPPLIEFCSRKLLREWQTNLLYNYGPRPKATVKTYSRRRKRG
jgi:hypothetical protein